MINNETNASNLPMKMNQVVWLFEIFLPVVDYS